MNGTHHIVVATDFSLPAGRAVRRAALLARVLHGELHLLHVVHPLAFYPGPEFELGDLSLQDQAIAAGARARLEGQAAALRAEFAITTHAATRIGRAHTEIAAHARQIGARLVVAGARGENTLLDLLLGSTATRLLRVADCPVLIAKLQAEPAPYAEVIVALDFSPGSEAATPLCHTVAPDARVELLHVYEAAIDEQLRMAGLETVFIEDYHERARAAAEARLEEMSRQGAPLGSVNGHVATGYPAAAIIERIKLLRAELVVLGRSGKSGMQEFLLGSVAKDVANAAECDVLVLPPSHL